MFLVRINDTVTFVEDGFDEDIEFGDEISDDDEDDVDNVSFYIFRLSLSNYLFIFLNSVVAITCFHSSVVL